MSLKGPYWFRAQEFPITIEFLHPDTRAVVHTITIEQPEHMSSVYIPPLAKQLGHPVKARIRFATGEVREE